MHNEGNDIQKNYVTDEELELLSQIHEIYKKCKKYFIRAEECLPRMELFVAPLLEHRDALDHTMRYYDKKNRGCSQSELIEELKRVRGHEVRAFYDIADYTCILIRTEISQRLKRVSRQKIKKYWPTYAMDREMVMKYSEELADIRQGRTDFSESIPKYESVLEKFYTTYTMFLNEVEPKL